MAFDQSQYANEYTRQNYDRLQALVPKGKGKEVKALANAQGKSVSQIIVEALEAHWGIDLGRQDGG